MTISDEKIKNYIIYKEELDKIKAIESEMRIEIANAIKDKMGKDFDNDKKKLKWIGKEYEILGEIPLNINCDKDFRKQAEETLNDIIGFDQISEWSKEEFDCFDIKIELNESRYKKFKKIKGKEFVNTKLCTLVTEKDGMPQLKIKKL